MNIALNVIKKTKICRNYTTALRGIIWAVRNGRTLVSSQDIEVKWNFLSL